MKRVDFYKWVYPSITEYTKFTKRSLDSITPLNYSLGLEAERLASSNSKNRPFSKRSKPQRSFDHSLERVVLSFLESSRLDRTWQKLNKIRTKRRESLQ